MSAIVFIGPTISEAEVRSVLEAECWSPAAQGDVYRALQARPRCIGIIDGYFDGVASVWHKEILWAVSEGVAVFGASSMGALRAAELSEFGMVGVGRIFEGFKTGALEDDDEVAVVHSPAELDYMPLSEPMVNIRPTLEHAVESGVLSTRQSDDLCALAKALDYPQRTWEQILDLGAVRGIVKQSDLDLAKWVSGNRIDQKKQDAVELLEAMKQSLKQTREAPDLNFDFEHTILWQHGTAAWSGPQETPQSARHVLDELMFSDQQYPVRQRALARKFATDTAFERQLEVSAAERREVTRQFREAAGLLSAADLRRWLGSNDLDEVEFKDLLVEELCLAHLAGDNPDALDAHTLGVLKLAGIYEALADRALHKAEILEKAGAQDAGPHDLDLPPSSLEDWYIERYPDYGGFGSLENFITAHGLQSKDEFYTILVREHLYLKEIETDA